MQWLSSEMKHYLYFFKVYYYYYYYFILRIICDQSL